MNLRWRIRESSVECWQNIKRICDGLILYVIENVFCCWLAKQERRRPASNSLSVMRPFPRRSNSRNARRVFAMNLRNRMLLDDCNLPTRRPLKLELFGINLKPNSNSKYLQRCYFTSEPTVLILFFLLSPIVKKQDGMKGRIPQTATTTR